MNINVNQTLKNIRNIINNNLFDNNISRSVITQEFVKGLDQMVSEGKIVDYAINNDNQITIGYVLSPPIHNLSIEVTIPDDKNDNMNRNGANNE